MCVDKLNVREVIHAYVPPAVQSSERQIERFNVKSIGIDGRNRSELYDFIASKAAGTNLYGLRLPSDEGLYLNEIRFPYPSGFIMGMAYIVSAYRAFSANITFPGHDVPALSISPYLVFLT